MATIEPFLEEIDRRWKRTGEGRIRLGVIGSAALMLQTDYVRGTKDGDVLETGEITAEVRAALTGLAGKGTPLHARFGMYLDVVIGGLPFLPQRPAFHPVASLKGLRHFEVEALDVVDVIVSKLMRFNAADDADARAMAERGLLQRGRLVERFKAAVDRFSIDARAEDLPKVVKNLHRVEREYLGAVPSDIELPGWIE